MHILIIDKGTHNGTTGCILLLIQHLYYLLTQNNILCSDINNIYIQTDKIINIIYEPIPNKIIFDKTINYTNESLIVNLDYKNIKKNLINFNNISFLCKKIKFNNKYFDKYNINNNSNNTLCIHFRLTDMNLVHNKENIKTYNHFLNETMKTLQANKIDLIFIASDNHESINKFINDISYLNIPIKYNKTIYRGETEIENIFETLLKNNNSKELYIDCIKDVLCLSQGQYLIHSLSNVSNLAILLSNTLNNIVYI
jgi:hypothetical protein